ncbi:MAG: hypothetical protein WDW36_000209 [Sanguina aurantia]
MQAGETSTWRRAQEHHSSRRQTILRSTALAPVVLGYIASDPATIFNSILGAYGIPNLISAATGYKLYDEFTNDYSFEYPRAWVARENSARQGIIASDFQTADKAQVEVFPLQAGDDIVLATIRRAVVPVDGQEDDKLNMPSPSSIRIQEELIDGVKYVYLRFPSDTITRSGYNIRRKHIAVAALRVKNGMVYSLSASSRSDQYNKQKEEVLKHVVESFRIR